MSELLSNDEIDSLVAVYRAERAGVAVSPPAGKAEPASGVRGVDLLKPNRFTRDQLRLLERLLVGAAGGLSACMSDRLRLDVACDCLTVEQMRFSAWLRQLDDSVAIYVLDMPPFDTPVLLSVSTDLLHGVVDRVLGGSGDVTTDRDALTDAEFAVADAFVGPCLDRVCRGLQELGLFSWTIEARTCNPAAAEILPDQDVVVAAHFQVSSAPALGDLRLVVPYSAMAPRLDEARRWVGSAGETAPGALREVTDRAVRALPLAFRVQLGESELSLRELLELAPGDVVRLRAAADQPLHALVQDRPKFRGRIGARGRSLAFQVAEVVERS